MAEETSRFEGKVREALGAPRGQGRLCRPELTAAPGGHVQRQAVPPEEPQNSYALMKHTLCLFIKKVNYFLVT